ncbi:hypothetical protein [Vibrio parahaemolyticus]|uniref:hypothetical protein n=1 Tax=Vibrio parahaemolyticus TaxID=670 RepID=UPI00111D297D|nr:hypothetical protein [Vibrio parahaemolyticus]EHR6779025.1 hypothetical protein [Vibrio parahaemolyticus]TOH32089.1 hypothetical protein CGI83_02510 [Vibrio parahaemolyticus]HCG9143263.1 hypothetical protein [Vibrio parahaemolyticus]
MENSIKEVAVILSWENFAVFAIIVSALQFLIGLWIKARLESSIKHEYDKKLEDFKYEQKVREQAAKVSKLLAEARNGDASLSRDRATSLNQQAWELILWLPEKTARKLSVHLSGDNKVSMKSILIDVRKLLLKNDNDGLKSDEIVHFTADEDKSA